MKKRIPSFLAGALTTALVCGLSLSALAANGLISINAALNNIAIEVNGQPAIMRNENYVPASGKETAGSILYNETTYVPLRKVAELLGAEVKWDASTGTANIVGHIEATSDPSPLPDNTSAPHDYSDWTPEEESAYQEFKAMWEIGIGTNINGDADRNIAQYIGNLSYDNFIEKMKSLGRDRLERFMLKIQSELDLSNASEVPSLDFNWGKYGTQGYMFNVGFVYFGEYPPVVVIRPEL